MCPLMLRSEVGSEPLHTTRGLVPTSGKFWPFLTIQRLLYVFMCACKLDRVVCPKICRFKTDGWHFVTEFLATQKT